MFTVMFSGGDIMNGGPVGEKRNTNANLGFCFNDDDASMMKR